MDKSTNALNWFEIPVTDMGRAQKFYESVFDIQMDPMPDMPELKMVAFPSEPGNGKASGALVKSPYHKPSQEGAVIYLNADPHIQQVIDRIEKAGGQVLKNKEAIGEYGFIAIFNDTEGNMMALHANG